MSDGPFTGLVKKPKQDFSWMHGLLTDPNVDANLELRYPKVSVPFNSNPLFDRAFHAAMYQSGNPVGIKPPNSVYTYGEPDADYNIPGEYDFGNNRLEMSRNALTQALERNDPASVDTLVHELTHYIQHKSNMSPEAMDAYGDALQGGTFDAPRPVNADDNDYEYHAAASGQNAEIATKLYNWATIMLPLLLSRKAPASAFDSFSTRYPQV
jgi:hypothetical protein